MDHHVPPGEGDVGSVDVNLNHFPLHLFLCTLKAGVKQYEGQAFDSMTSLNMLYATEKITLPWSQMTFVAGCQKQEEENGVIPKVLNAK